MFTPSNVLKKYLNATPRDMYDIVGALMSYIDVDSAFETNEFDEAVQYVLKHGVSESELYAEFDSEIEFEEDQSKWDEEYYLYARVYLKENFSKKRIKHVKAIARKLYPNGIKKSIPNPALNGEEDSALNGGSKSSGKKTQDQQHLNQNNRNLTIMESHSAKIPVLIISVVIVLLVLVIAVITK